MTDASRVTAGLHCIVLAAGASRRLGSPKQLLAAGDRTLLELATGTAADLFGQRVTVVLGANAAELQPLLDKQAIRSVYNEEWSEGMAASIRCGIANLAADVAAVLLIPVDQPQVSTADLGRLAAAWQTSRESPVAAAYSGTVGIPAIFPRRLFAALSQLSGDTGARSVLRACHGEIVEVPIPGAAFDLDTPEDVRRFEKEVSKKGSRAI